MRTFIRASLVAVSIPIGLLLLVLGPIGLGNAIDGSSSEFHFGYFSWLIWAKHTYRDMVTGAFTRETQIVLNPKGFAWTLSAVALWTAFLIWTWRRTRYRR